MTREEAKEYAKEMTYRDAVYNALQGKCIPYRKATLIKLYELLDRLEQEPCGEAISREDALMCLTGEWTEITDEIIHRFIKRIKALPPVNPQPKTGHWIISPNDCFATCSECGLSGDKGIFKHYRWCPICGTKMSEIPTGSDPQESEKVN